MVKKEAPIKKKRKPRVFNSSIKPIKEQVVLERVSKRGRINEWRPYKWTDPDELARKIDDYFAQCDAFIETTPNLFFEEEIKAYEEKMEWWENKTWKDEKQKQKHKPIKPLKEYRQQKSKPYTISWLCLHLSCDKETIIEYAKLGQFSDTIKNAYLKVQWQYEDRLHGNNPTGAIFALKNFGRKDKTEVEQSTTLQFKTPTRDDIQNAIWYEWTTN